MKRLILNILLNLIAKTWRIKVIGNKPYKESLIGFWHGKMLPAWYIFRKRKPCAVVSLSKDGELLSSLLEFWGFTVRRGSSSKGGKEILEQITNDVLTNLVLITPDGPRGPQKEMKPGILIASKRSMKPYYFLCVSIDKSKKFKSWDRFELPLPFSKIRIKIIGPKFVKVDSDKEEVSNLISTLNKEFENC